MKKMKVAFYAILGFIGVLVIVFGLNYLGLVNFRFFAPKYEDARRKVYENTQSYVEGKRQTLTKYYNEWRKSDPDEKSAIRAVVLQEFANFDTDKFTTKQREWYDDITE